LMPDRSSQLQALNVLPLAPGDKCNIELEHPTPQPTIVSVHPETFLPGPACFRLAISCLTSLFPSPLFSLRIKKWRARLISHVPQDHFLEKSFEPGAIASHSFRGKTCEAFFFCWTPSFNLTLGTSLQRCTPLPRRTQSFRRSGESARFPPSLPTRQVIVGLNARGDLSLFEFRERIRYLLDTFVRSARILGFGG